MLLTQEKKEKVSQCLEWNLEKPKKFLIARKGFDKDYVENLEIEYKRYLAIKALNPNEYFPISNSVDELWHAHILFTEDYRKMSNELIGNYFNHYPTITDDEAIELEPYYFNDTLVKYEQLFGKPSEEFWPHERGSICWSKG